MLTRVAKRSSSTDLTDLRRTAQALYRTGVVAADPRGRTERALAAESGRIAAASRVHLVALGKAALPMIEAALDKVCDKTAAALAVTYAPERQVPDMVELIAAGHPVPNGESARAGLRIAEIARQVLPGDLLITLISGGGSALAVLPVEGISLEDKIATNALLLASGASIVDLNAIRRGLSQLKGGGLARLAGKGDVMSLILSDVPGDDLSTIASGPTVLPGAQAASGEEVAKRLGIWDDLPARVQWALATQAYPNDNFAERLTNRIIGSNELSVRAIERVAMERVGKTIRLGGWLDGDVRDTAQHLHWFARHSCDRSTKVLLAGGETTVRVTGKGKGGRNQELALYFALADRERPLDRPWAFLSGGSDGRDGPTDAAGAVVDAGSLDWMEQQGIDLNACLADNDSYRALAESGDLMITGNTETNVADFQILVLL